MPLIERSIYFYGEDEEGNTTIDFPVTILENVEDTAEIESYPDDSDYIPLIDISAKGQMKKTTLASIRAKADRLSTPRTIQTNLASTTSDSFDGTRNVTPGITGVLSLVNGGTGASTASSALSNLGVTATAAELNHLDGITATVTELNYTDGVTSNIQVQLDSKSENSHTHTLDDISETTSKKIMTTDERTKLSNIANSANNYTHPNSGITSGTYKSVTVNEAGHVTGGTNPTTLVGYGITDALKSSLKGTANGLAELDSSGKVPSSQLPSYVDDVIEKSGIANFPSAGESGKIYVDTSTNKTYRWGGSAYTEISASLALGETPSTAYRGDRGKIAYDHSQSAHAPSNAQANQNAFSKITVGSTTVSADTPTDTLTLVAGSNITLTPDTTNDKITITNSYSLPVAGSSLGGVKSGGDVSISNGVITVKGGNANTVGGKPATSFFGGGFVYPYSNGGVVLNNIKTDNHIFLFNVSGTPTAYGFLDVKYFSGSTFAPSTTGVVLQIWHDYYNPAEIYYRLWRKNNQNDSTGTWTAWTRANSNTHTHSTYVTLNTAQNISGEKTFTTPPIIKFTGTGGGFNEGIRLSGKSKDDSWSIICLGCDPNATSGVHPNQWLIARSAKNQFIIDNGASLNTTFCINTDKNIGIGTGSPSQKLTVVGNISVSGSLIGNVTGNCSGSSGSCTGNAATATKATQDSAGQQINTTYIKGLSVSGTTITYTKGDGKTGTIPTQDTTYEVATTSADGLMSKADKAKLDSLSTSSNGGTSGGYVTAGQKEGTTLGKNATAEGEDTTASSSISHAEGYGTVASGYCSHAEGNYTTASGSHSHSEGNGTTASEDQAHAEGRDTTASNSQAHAEGDDTTASGSASHAEGKSTVAQGHDSHAEGLKTKAILDCSHAEGNSTTAQGYYSHAEGSGTVANGNSSHAGGVGTIAANYHGQYAIGKYNVETTESYLVIGKGSSNTTRANAFRVSDTGAVFGCGAYNSSGADYAEYFEWYDGNPNNEDRRGIFVTVINDKIIPANSKTKYILGVVSGSPSVIGDSHDDQWNQMYLTDIYGSPIFEDIEIPEEADENGKVIFPAHIERRQKLNPNYDPTKKYIPRSQRPEWNAVGLVGKLVVNEDGTCKVNGFCKVNDEGIATLADENIDRKCWRVIKRLDKSHIQIIFSL